ncbi:hypothetical protein, partial [Myxococcus xanthus]
MTREERSIALHHRVLAWLAPPHVVIHRAQLFFTNLPRHQVGIVGILIEPRSRVAALLAPARPATKQRPARNP